MLFEDINYILEKNNNSEFFTPQETLVHGILFKNDYKPYKDYQISQLRMEPNLLRIFELDQVLNDLNLYLDLYPTDKKALDLFYKYSNENDKLKKQFSNNKYPFCLSDMIGNEFDWLSNPWPWENTEDKYV